jgi:MinD superfamily P-loop ATPase
MQISLASETIRTMKLRMGVVINRADLAGSAVRQFCRHRHIPILGELPNDRAVAEAYSRGQLPCDIVPGYRKRIEGLLRNILSSLESE